MVKRTLLFCLFVICLCCSTARGLNFIGPPRACVDQGKFGTYFCYSKSEIEIDVSGAPFTYLGSTIELPDKIEIERYDSAIAYGILKNWEVFFQFGGLENNTELDVSSAADVQAESDLEITWGCGTRVTVFQSNGFSLGGTCQMSWVQNLDVDARVNRGAWEHVLEGELDMTEIQIAAGPSYYIANVLSVYGGPFVHYIKGEYSHKETAPALIGVDTSDVHEAAILGGYVGASAELFNIAAFFIEWQYTADADAWAMGLLLSL